MRFRSLVLLACTFVSFSGCAEVGPRPIRDSGANPERYSVVLFPKRSQLVDQAGETHLVERAVPVKLSEAQSDTVGVYIGANKVKFDRANFSHIPPNGLGQTLMNRLNIALSEDPDPEAYRSAKFSVTSTGVCTYELRMNSGRSIVSEYTVDGNDVANPIP